MKLPLNLLRLRWITPPRRIVGRLLIAVLCLARISFAQDPVNPLGVPEPILSAPAAPVSPPVPDSAPAPSVETLAPAPAPLPPPAIEPSLPEPGAFELQPSLQPPSRTSELSAFVSDRSAAAFDHTTPRFNRFNSSYGPSLAAPPSTGHPGPFAFAGSLSVGEVAEKETGNSARGRRGWEIGTQLSGSLQATIGHPLTGRYLELQYAGSYQLGGRPESDGSLDQAVSLTGYYTFAKLKLLLAADYSHTTGPDRDIGASTDRDLTAVSLQSEYPLSLKSSLSLTLSENSSRYQAGINSEDTRAALYFNRQISLKTNLGLGGTFGSVAVDQGDDQTLQQLNLRASYVPSLKTTLAAMVGYEWRQIGGKSSGTPVFDASLSFAARPTTTFSFSASRSVSNSAARSQTNYTSSTIQLSVSQKLNLRISATLALGYQNASYDSTSGTTSAEAGREDNLLFARPSLNFQVSPQLGVSFSYSFSKNQSNQRGFETQSVHLSGSYTF